MQGTLYTHTYMYTWNYNTKQILMTITVHHHTTPSSILKYFSTYIVVVRIVAWCNWRNATQATIWKLLAMNTLPISRLTPFTFNAICFGRCSSQFVSVLQLSMEDLQEQKEWVLEHARMITQVTVFWCKQRFLHKNQEWCVKGIVISRNALTTVQTCHTLSSLVSDPIYVHSTTRLHTNAHMGKEVYFHTYV